MADTHGDLKMPLERNVLQHDRRARLEPPVLVLLQPLVDALLELVQLLDGRTPGELHRQVLECFLYVQRKLGQTTSKLKL